MEITSLPRVVDAVLQGRTLNTNTWPSSTSHAPTRRPDFKTRALTCLALRNLVHIFAFEVTVLLSNLRQLPHRPSTPVQPVDFREEACSGHCAVNKLETKSRPNPPHRSIHSALSARFLKAVSYQAAGSYLVPGRRQVYERGLPRSKRHLCEVRLCAPLIGH